MVILLCVRDAERLMAGAFSVGAIFSGEFPGGNEWTE